MSRLRIVSICRTLPTPEDPAEGIFVLNRLRAMARIADVTVIQPLPYLPGVRPLPEWAVARQHEAGGLQLLHAPMLYVPGVLKSADDRWLAYAVKPVLERLHREKPVDLIDAHFGFPDGAGSLAAGRRLGIPVSITIRGFETEYLRWPLVGPRLARAMREAHACIAVSHSLRELALEHGVDSSRLQVVHNAVDWETFYAGSRTEARRRLGLATDASVVLTVGHLIERKRHHVLVEAFAPLARVNASLQLVVLGGSVHEPAYRVKLDTAIRASGVGDRIRLLGSQPPGVVADWLRAADAFGLGTAREGCCNAVLEALACGLPVVTTPVGDNTTFIEAGRNGELVPVDDAVAMSVALERALAADRWDRAAIAASLKARVGTWEVVGERVVEFLQERLGRIGALTA
jgi:glycosyltransferase involved in cell wall biosynthesis